MQTAHLVSQVNDGADCNIILERCSGTQEPERSSASLAHKARKLRDRCMFLFQLVPVGMDAACQLACIRLRVVLVRHLMPGSCL